MESVSARLPDDVARELDEFAERRGISQSEAIRRLIVTGLEQDELEQRLGDLEARVDRIDALERRVERLERSPFERLLSVVGDRL